MNIEEFNRLFKNDLEFLSENELDCLSKIKIEPYALQCLRRRGGGVESVYIVASRGSQLLLYDDVEDEYGVALKPEDNLLRDWDLFGDLAFALRRFL